MDILEKEFLAKLEEIERKRQKRTCEIEKREHKSFYRKRKISIKKIIKTSVKKLKYKLESS